MGALGIGDDCRVVLYSAGSVMWATRVWWMLRAFGFERAAVLDGGWEKWRAEGRPVSAEPVPLPAGALHRDAESRAGSWTGTTCCPAWATPAPPR